MMNRVRIIVEINDKLTK